MTAKTKKLIAGTLIAVPMLAMSILTPISLVKQANADTVEDPLEITTEKSYFAEFGLTLTYEFETYDYGVVYEYSQPFFPYVFTSVPQDSNVGFMDGSLVTMFEDYPDASANNRILYSVYYEDPTYENDGGIIDDGIISSLISHSFTYDDGDLAYESATIHAKNVFLNLDDLSEMLSSLYIPSYKTATLSYTCNEQALHGWISKTYADDLTMDDHSTLKRFSDHSFTPRIRGFGYYTDFMIVINYNSNRVAEGMHFSFNGNPNHLIAPIGYNIPTMSEYLNEYNFVVNSPTVDDTLYGMVTGFLETEFLPNFTFGDLLLLGMGITLFFMFLKIFAGG